MVLLLFFTFQPRSKIRVQDLVHHMKSYENRTKNRRLRNLISSLTVRFHKIS